MYTLSPSLSLARRLYAAVLSQIEANPTFLGAQLPYNGFLSFAVLSTLSLSLSLFLSFFLSLSHTYTHSLSLCPPFFFKFLFLFSLFKSSVNRWRVLDASQSLDKARLNIKIEGQRQRRCEHQVWCEMCFSLSLSSVIHRMTQFESNIIPLLYLEKR